MFCCHCLFFWIRCIYILLGTSFLFSCQDVDEKDKAGELLPDKSAEESCFHVSTEYRRVLYRKIKMQQTDAKENDDDGWDENTNNNDWNGVQLSVNDEDSSNEWSIALDNKYTDAMVQQGDNPSLAIQHFFECIKMEEQKYTEMRDKRFNCFKHIILLQSRQSDLDSTLTLEPEILHNFQLLCSHYDPSQPVRGVSNNDMNNALRMIFNSLKAHNRVSLLLKMAEYATTHFRRYTEDANVDEWAKMCVQFTLKLIQKDYVQKLDMKYAQQINACDDCALYNAVTDGSYLQNKIIVDFGGVQQYNDMHLKRAIQLDITQAAVDEKTMFDIIFKHIKLCDYPEVYCYGRRQSQNNTNYDQEKETKLAQSAQYLLWKNLMKVIPFYMYANDLEVFEIQYPFLCESEKNVNVKKHSKLFEFDGYPNQILEKQLFLGTIKHANNGQMLKWLHITHIVNVTEMEYGIPNIKMLNIHIGDIYTENIERYFETAANFIDDALQNENHKVLVHCRAGVSRSSTIVISYLMIKKQMRLQQAFDMVHQKRPKIAPNSGFMQQLEKLQKSLFGNIE